MQISLVTLNTFMAFNALFDVQAVKALSIQFHLFRHNPFQIFSESSKILGCFVTFLVNVTAVLRTLPDENLVWLKRELYSNSCGHAS
jgi:hypothetical protein